MYSYLKSFNPTQQIGALFVIVFGLLLFASVCAFLLRVGCWTGLMPRVLPRRCSSTRYAGTLACKTCF